MSQTSVTLSKSLHLSESASSPLKWDKGWSPPEGCSPLEPARLQREVSDGREPVYLPSVLRKYLLMDTDGRTRRLREAALPSRRGQGPSETRSLPNRLWESSHTACSFPDGKTETPGGQADQFSGKSQAGGPGFLAPGLQERLASSSPWPP